MKIKLSNKAYNRKHLNKNGFFFINWSKTKSFKLRIKIDGKNE